MRSKQLLEQCKNRAQAYFKPDHIYCHKRKHFFVFSLMTKYAEKVIDCTCGKANLHKQ